MIKATMRAAALALALATATGSVAAEREVDLALVLAVDISWSMDAEEQRLQRDGYVSAFRSQAVANAIRKGALGRIAVTYVEWSGPGQQTVVAPWTVLEGAKEAGALADRLAAAPIGRVYSTSISGAIDFSVQLLRDNGPDAMRRVIDISGDGPNNTGRGVAAARDEAVAQGIVINGLPFMLKRPSGQGDIENLDLYYEDCVIGGQGAFVIPIRERHQIEDATRAKLVREIADERRPEALIQRAQARERSNCLIGEIMRRQRYGP